MSAFTALPWLADLDPAEREYALSDLISAAIDYWRDAPADDALTDVCRVLDEWKATAADPDRIRPSHVVTLAQAKGGDHG